MTVMDMGLRVRIIEAATLTTPHQEDPLVFCGAATAEQDADRFLARLQRTPPPTGSWTFPVNVHLELEGGVVVEEQVVVDVGHPGSLGVRGLVGRVLAYRASDVEAVLEDAHEALKAHEAATRLHRLLVGRDPWDTHPDLPWYWVRHWMELRLGRTDIALPRTTNSFRVSKPLLDVGVIP